MPFEERAVVVYPNQDRAEVRYVVEIRRPIDYPEEAVTTKQREEIRKKAIEALRVEVRKKIMAELELQEVKPVVKP